MCSECVICDNAHTVSWKRCGCKQCDDGDCNTGCCGAQCGCRATFITEGEEVSESPLTPRSGYILANDDWSSQDDWLPGHWSKYQIKSHMSYRAHIGVEAKRRIIKATVTYEYVEEEDL